MSKHNQCADCGKCRATPNEDWCADCAYSSCERGNDCADATPISADIALVLAEHVQLYVFYARGPAFECKCGERIENFAIHQATVLAPLILRERAEAIREAADDMDEVIASGDIAEVAAPVEGSVGRSEAVSVRDSLYEEPSHWLRGYADAVEDEAERAADIDPEGAEG